MKSLTETLNEMLTESNGPKVGDIGSWHGNFATVLYTDEDEVCFIVGSYKGREFQEILKKFEAEDPKFWDEHEDNIITVSLKEWKRQQ